MNKWIILLMGLFTLSTYHLDAQGGRYYGRYHRRPAYVRPRPVVVYSPPVVAPVFVIAPPPPPVFVRPPHVWRRPMAPYRVYHSRRCVL